MIYKVYVFYYQIVVIKYYPFLTRKFPSFLSFIKKYLYTIVPINQYSISWVDKMQQQTGSNNPDLALKVLENTHKAVSDTYRHTFKHDMGPEYIDRARSAVRDIRKTIDSADKARYAFTVMPATDNGFWHPIRVALTCYGIFWEMLDQGLYAQALKSINIEDTLIGALLHDIGKAKDWDFFEGGQKCTEREEHYKEDHVIKGARQLYISGAPATATNISLAHHLSYDGSKGYPSGLVGKVVPDMPVRMVSAGDTFSALTGSRGYRRGQCSSDEAMHLISSQQNHDPLIIHFLEKLVQNTYK